MISLGEDRTNYHGKKEKVAVVTLAGRRFPLGLNDTTRAAHSLEAAERMLANLAAAAGVENYQANGDAPQLHQHCRKLIGINEEPAV